MSATLLSLLAFVAWTMILALGYVGIRVGLVLSGKRKSNEFPADVPHEGPPLYKRLIRAHLNCVENLPLYASVTLVAAVLGVTGLTDPYAWWYVGFRVAQSSIHIIGTSPMLVNARAGCLLGQYAVLVSMIAALVR